MSLASRGLSSEQEPSMGIDLKILASNFRERDGHLLATASIRADRDPRLLSIFSTQATACIVKPLPDGLTVGHDEDAGLRFDDKDRYGRPLTFTTPQQLQAFRDIEEINQWNRAIISFLVALPPDTKIVLYWC